MSAKRSLSPEHAAMLRASAISDEVAGARGYWTATKRTELADLGFARYQQIAPALVVPVWGVEGEIVNYQARPETPRIDPERGREIKYETVAGSSVRLDVPPPCRPLIGRPDGALWITEGAKKADALATAGLTAIALLGVDCFKTDDWDRVALDGRRVYVCFDSDAMIKRSVYGALSRLAGMLDAKGAAVSFAYLPTDNGKVGVDDYLAAGHTVEGLYALVEPDLREPPPEPKPERTVALPTAQLLNVVEQLFCRFVRFSSKHESTVLALFTLHTHALDAARATPYLLVISPEKRSGKTRVLEVLELAVREPIRASNISAAGVFQAVEKWQPTLLIDEIDTIFIAKSEAAEALRGAIGGGNRPGSFVIRGTQDGEPARFETYCPKVLAGINTGKLPDTIRDRSIVITMKRRNPGETIDDLFPAELADQLAELRRRIEDWAAENVEHLSAWRRPERVAGLDDRLQEAWDPLLAISDLAQAGWSEKSRQAATALAKGAEDVGEATHGHVLIEALRTTFGIEPALSSQAICSKLNADEELPFVAYSAGTGIKPRDLAKLLRPYGIKSKVVRTGAETARGYHRDQFGDVWQRYSDAHARAGASKEGSQGSQGSHPNADGALGVTPVTPVTPPESPPRACAFPEDGKPRRRSTIDYDLLRANAATNCAVRLSREQLAALTSEQRLSYLRGRRQQHERELAAGAPTLAGPGLESGLALCGCQEHRDDQRVREWRLAGEALDVSSTYVSNAAHREAVEQGRHIVSKGKRSGWSIETAKTGRGNLWMCALCHPPAEGLDVEWRVADDGARRPDGRLRWRYGYGWRRDGKPDGEPLAGVELSDEAFLRKVGGPRLVREWQRRARQEDVRAGEAEPVEPVPEHKANWNHFDPNAPPIMNRYSGRPKQRAEIAANVRAWERLKTMGGPVGPREGR